MTLLLQPKVRFEKCGEILTASNAGDRLFELKCIFCASDFENLPAFVDHINNHHLNLLLKEEESVWTSANNFYDCSSIAFEGGTVSTKVENEAIEYNLKETSNENDPLNEPIFKIEINEDLMTDTVDENSEHENSYNSHSDDSETKSTISDFSNIESDNEREITSTLIADYRKLPVLWDTKHSHFKKPQQRKIAVKKLVNGLTFQFAKEFRDRDIIRRLRKLRRRYTSDLHKQKVAESNGETYTPCWFFEKLDFIRNTIDLSGKDDAIFEKNIKPTGGSLSAEQQIQMIDIYESFPCLWNTQHTGYRFKSKRRSAMQEMLRCIEDKMQLKLDEQKLKRKLYRIRFMCTKEKSQQIKCERQKINYKPKCKFYAKTKFLYDHVNPFKCSDCSKIFKGYDQYQKHLSSHSGTQPFSCTICQKGFNQIGILNAHIRRHKRDFEFICKDCGKGFISSSDLLTHTRTHTKIKPYCCEICGKSFAQECGFRRHKKWHDKRFSCFCELCKKGFYDRNSLREHMNIHLNIRDKICNVCGKAFTTNAYLRKHKETHSEKKYNCKICSKSFAQYAGLFTHMKMH